MKQCPECGRSYEDSVSFCPIDGNTLSGTQNLGSIERDKLANVFVGMVIEKKYRLEREIGRGGMGCVYRATHLLMDSPVAVKVLHKNLVEDDQAVERFRREARAAARIRHPNAVSVMDFGVTASGLVYLVMEYLEGTDLSRKLHKRGRLQADETVRIVVQICAAVAKAHSRGVVHRDLKPENVWLCEDDDTGEERVKVLDFGIAKLKTQEKTIANLTQSGMIVGTPQYMSPEQSRGDDLDPRSDIYSIGVMLYEMLSGKRPIDGPNPMSVAVRQSTEIPPPLRVANPEVAPELEAVVMRALEKDREKRQSTATELARELLEALEASGAKTLQLPASALPDHQAFAGDPDLSVPPESSFPPELRTPQTPFSTRPSQETRIPSGHGYQHPVTPSGQQPVTLGRSFPPKSNWVSQEMGKPGVAPAVLAGAVVAAATLLIVAGIVIYMVSSGGETSPPGVEPAAASTAPFVVPEGMVRVPGGTFMMGTNEGGAQEESKPARQVPVSDFLLDVTEVTNEEYAKFLRATRRPAPEHWPNGEIPRGDAQLPVYNVSWDDANEYAKWAGKRLPTEAEWEYAARGTNGFKYPWGSDWSPQRSNSKEDGKEAPVAVRSYPNGASWAGVYDLAGNVAEWVADDFRLYEGSKGKPQPNCKVFRGGAFTVPKEYCAATFRWADLRTTKERWIGFRCAKDVPKEE